MTDIPTDGNFITNTIGNRSEKQGIVRTDNPEEIDDEGNGKFPIAQIKMFGLSMNDSGISFETKIGGTLAERMGIDRKGNVGIGVTNPPAKLSIKGNEISFQNVSINANTNMATGSGFFNNIAKGDIITISGETKTVIDIPNDNTIHVDSEFENTTPTGGALMAVHPCLFRAEDHNGDMKLIISDNGNVGIFSNEFIPPKTSLHLPDKGLQIGNWSSEVWNDSFNNFYMFSDTISCRDTLTRRRLSLYKGDYKDTEVERGNNNSLLTVLVNGNVGIGINDPLEKLEIDGNIKTNGMIGLLKGVAIDEFSADGTLADNSDLAVPTEKAVKTYVDGKGSKWSNIVGGGGIYYNNGNVGIGTLSPRELLQIDDWIAFHNGGWKGLFFNTYYDNGNKRLNTGRSSAILFDTDVGALRIYTGHYGNKDEDAELLERFTISNDGSIGIGTTSHNATLAVAGKIKITDEMEVSGHIHCPKWRVTNVFEMARGPLPISNTFVSGGGTLLIFASGSGWADYDGCELGMWISIDHGILGQANVLSNEANSHKAFPAKLIVSPVAFPAGSHTFELLPIGNTLTDMMDNFNVTILELPF